MCGYVVAVPGLGMIETVRTLLFRGSGTTTVHECRRCGTTVERADQTCPNCDSDRIATVSTD